MRLHSRAAATVLLAPLVVVSSMAPDTRDAGVASPSAIIPTEYLEVTSLPFSTAGTPARAEPLPRGASLRGRLSPEPSDASPTAEAPPEAVPAPEQAAPSPA
ncbi:MAG: hypothetical protein M3O91_08590, partial [Chloroflexota bacterium]|nr:hypothetical protein [Chloroflexota bacterium]